jgi:hypothetical protein
VRKDGPPAAWPKKPLDAGLLAKLTGDLELVGYEDRNLNDSQKLSIAKPSGGENLNQSA